MTIDIGDLCTHCGEDTSMGSGKFVNRIPSGASWEFRTDAGYLKKLDVSGYMCSECQLMECDRCGEKVLDEWETIDDDVVCMDCMTEDELIERGYQEEIE